MIIKVNDSPSIVAKGAGTRSGARTDDKSLKSSWPSPPAEFEIRLLPKPPCCSWHTSHKI